jgi:hypothetical protein
MFFTLQEVQNRPTGVSVPTLGLYNKAICSLLYMKPRTDQQEIGPTGVSVPALGLYNKAICSLLYRKPRTDQQELVFLL